jgi:cytochrome c-L
LRKHRTFEARLSSKAGRWLSMAGGAAFGILAVGPFMFAAEAPKIQFKHIAFDTPLDVKPRPDEKITPAVQQFYETGKDPYVGNPQAVAEGKKLYDTHCASCHMPNGSGGMGASLISENPTYPRNKTDVGLFETVYGGALGAMQPFNDRLTQDEILKVIAYIHELRKKR